MPRLGIVLSHPIQYYTPWLRALAARVEIEVCYCRRPEAREQLASGFGSAFDWDIPLLDGYPHRFLKNTAARPSVEQYAGCDTPEIEEAVAAGRYDSVLVCGWHLKSYRQAAAACRRHGVPLLVRGDGVLVGEPRWKRMLRLFSHPRLLRRFDRFLAVGRRAREYLLYYGVPPERLHDAPHSVEVSRFAVAAEKLRPQRPRLRHAFGLREDSVVFLFVGRFVKIKRPADMVRAAALRFAGNKRREILFVGDGPLKESVAREARRAGVACSFAGFLNQSRLPEAYVAADVLFLPSRRETWGLTVNEAQAAGIPAVVGNGVGCAPDLIEEGRTGYVYPSGDTAALAERQETATREIEAGHNFRPALRAKSEAYSPEATARGVAEAFAAALSERGKRGGQRR